MSSDNGLEFLLDLSKVTQLHEGDNLLLTDGRHIRVKAAAEDVMRVIVADRLHPHAHGLAHR